MKRQQNNLCIKDLSKIGKTESQNSMSNYSTCSDENFQNNNDPESESTILSGQICHESKRIDIALGDSVASETAGSETSYSINILDQNLDVLTEDDDDVFLDCDEERVSDTNNSNTIYVPIALTSELPEVRLSNHYYDRYVKLNNLELTTANDKMKDFQNQIENKRFTTILEETEMTRRTNSFRKKTSDITCNRTGGMVAEVINRIKDCDNLNNISTKRVLFVNENNTENVNEKSILRNPEKTPLLCRKDQCRSINKVVDRNCNVHNTTESFIMWEKKCIASESESYGGDDEHSLSFKTLDDTFLSHSSIHLNEITEVRKNFCRRRSKSCDSILGELRHLPHKALDTFLKCLSEEIESIRKKNIVCTCKKNPKKIFNKKTTKSTSIPPSLQVQNLTSGRSAPMPVLQVQNITETRNSKLQPTVSPYKSAHKESRLSPKATANNSENISRNLKSPRTPTNLSQKRGFYSVRKEIVSPVGEYIRGKRESPFKNSPSKNKT